MQAQLLHLWQAIGPFARFHEEVQAATAQALGCRFPITEASPTIFEVECGVRCNLVPFSQVRN